jgi:exonuclease III
MPLGHGLKLATWNVRSLGGNRGELEMFLRREGVAILAVQETHLVEGGWPLRIRGYQCMESAAAKGEPGKVGLALLVRDDLPAFRVGDVSPYTVCARVTLQGGGAAHDLLVASVYVPPSGYASRRDALLAVRTSAERWTRADLDARFILMGDWNTSATRLERVLQRWRGGAACPAAVCRCNGSALTYRGRTWRDLDHVVASPAAAAWLRPPRVNRTWDTSDHWPLEAVLRVPQPEAAQWGGADAAPQRGRPVRGLGLMGWQVLGSKLGEGIAHHNMWDVLALDDEEDPEHGGEGLLVEHVEETLARIGREQGFVATADEAAAGKSRAGYRLDGRARRAVDRRRRAHRVWVEREGPARRELWQQYAEERRAARAAVKQCVQNSWRRYVARGARDLADNDLRAFWRWARQVTGRSRYRASTVLRTQSGNLTADPREQLEAWAHHYRVLSADVTSHSRNFDMWAERLSHVTACDPLPEEDMNGEIGWAELNATLMRLRNGKAPGVDGIPGELLKAAVQETDDPAYDGVTPSSPMGAVLLKVVNRVFLGGEIPDRWRTALVVSLPKKGDLTKIDNYRGISLLPVLLKVLSTIVIRRITKGLEARRWFRPAQAGFRTREECPGHVAALLECLVRRRNRGQKTYLAFVDMRKAYDTVPHGALMRKLWLAGVRGRALAFMRALYDDIRLSVLTPHGASECVPVLRGVRQGCPASPAMFNIFVNDILDGLDRFGVSVPGLDTRVAGLLFADDLVVLAPSRRRLVRMLGALDEWADRNEMAFGVSKCGIMAVGRDGYALNERLRREADRYRLGGANVPIVDAYTYLGLVVSPLLSPQQMVDDRVTKGWRAFMALKPVLECTRIPLAIRVRLVKATLLPTVMYGAELWGMSATRCSRAEGLMREVLRSLLRLGRRSTLVSAVTLGRELSIPPVHARACASRARAFRKYATLRTVVAGLASRPISAGTSQRSWSVASRSWLGRFCPAPPAQADAETPRALANRVCSTVWESMADREGGRSMQRYRLHGFEATNGYVWQAVRFPALATGVHWLTRARVGALWMGRAYARIHWLPAEFLTRCMFCEVATAGETLPHMLVECPRWEAQRVSLEPLIDEARQRLGAAATVDNVALYLLGGRVGGEHHDNNAQGIRCTHWVKLGRRGGGAPQMGIGGLVDNGLDHAAPEVEEQQGPHGLEDDDDGDVEAGRVPGFVLVARFLQAVMPARFAELRPMLTITAPPRADAHMGRAALREGEGDHPLLGDDDAPA